MSDLPQDDVTELQESWISHLVELRRRLIYAMSSVLVMFLILMPWQGDIYTALAQPMLAVLPAGTSMIATDVTSSFFVPLKVTAMVAFIIVLPYILFQAWGFVAPGLYRHEQRLVLPLVVSSYLLFLAGMSFAYFLVFPTVFSFIHKITPQGVAMMTDIEKYLGFVMSTFLAFGLTFEVPVLVFVLVYLRFVSIAQLNEWRRYVIVAAFVIAAIFTPPDVLSQLMLAVPLWVLYELGIVVARLTIKPPEAVLPSKDTVSD